MPPSKLFSGRNGMPAEIVPTDCEQATLHLENRTVQLTNLRKVFWRKLGITKGDLIRYYADVSRWLLPHLRDRPMVMKRYPSGAEGEFFYMKRVPSPRPSWIQICSIPHKSARVIDFAVVQDLPSLLWMINLGCIDLNPWYSRCSDTDRPDFLNFDLDPVAGADFSQVCEAALKVKTLLETFQIPSYPKTTGSRGLHIYVPIQRGPLQKEVWGVAKTMARHLAARHPELITAEYRIAKRPAGRILVDYNQNAWGRTLAAVYSVRPTAHATVSAPVSWSEVEGGITIEEFRLDNMRERLRARGDLWKALLHRERYDLGPVVRALKLDASGKAGRVRPARLLRTTSMDAQVDHPAGFPSRNIPSERRTSRKQFPKSRTFRALVMVVLLLGTVWGSRTAATEQIKISTDPDGVQRIRMEVDSYSYRPDHIVVRSGIPLEITLTSVTTLTPHNFIIKEPEAGLLIEQEIGAGKTVTVRFTPTQRGSVIFYCDKRLLFFKSHRDRGMEGRLEVR